MMTRRDVLALIPLSLATVSATRLFADRQAKTATVTLTIDGMT